jgi:hypothetical protein
MDEFRSLLLNSRDDLGWQWPVDVTGDSRGEIEELIAIHVFNAHATATLGNERIRARIAGRNQARIGCNRGLGLGSGKRTNQFGSVLSVQFLLGHISSPRQIGLSGRVFSR